MGVAWYCPSIKHSISSNTAWGNFENPDGLDFANLFEICQKVEKCKKNSHIKDANKTAQEQSTSGSACERLIAPNETGTSGHNSTLYGWRNRLCT